MFRLILPREHGFFDHFSHMANLIAEGAKEFQLLLAESPAGIEARAHKIKDLEHAADSITHQTMTDLHKTFITPLDREDIHELIKRLDDVLDFLDAAAQRIVGFRITSFPDGMRRLADINTTSATLIQKAVAGLSNLKNSEELLKTCVEINRLENEADSALRESVARLFNEENDIKRLIQLKEITELLEVVSDRCEDVANVIESIIIEYS